MKYNNYNRGYDYDEEYDDGYGYDQGYEENRYQYNHEPIVILSGMSKLIWIIVLIITVGTIGHFILSSPLIDSSFKDKSGLKKDEFKKNIIHIKKKNFDTQNVNKEIVNSFNRACAKAEEYATSELDTWIKELEGRSNRYFLPWYFNYWNQQKMSFIGLWYSARHWWNSDKYPTAVNQITSDIQVEFSKKVLRPRIAQRRIEMITQNTVEKLVSALENDISSIQAKYEIDDIEWNAYLQDISFIVRDVNLNRQTPLTLKALTLSTVSSSYIILKIISSMLNRTTYMASSSAVAQSGSSTFLTKIAGASASKILSKAGITASSKVAGKMLGAFIGVGVIAWEVYDHRSSTAMQMPVLQKNLSDYFHMLKQMLLYDSNTGIINVLRSIIDTSEICV